MNQKFAVIGLGLFGSSIARTLAERGAEVIAVDTNLAKVEAIKDEVAQAVCLDATDPKALTGQNIHEADAVVVAIGEDFECLLLASVLLLELKVKRLISRAASDQQRMILEKLGVKEILSPEITVAKTVAESLLHPSIQTSLPLSDEYEIVEINTPKRVIDHTIQEINLRERYNLNLITIKRKFTEEKNGEVEEIFKVLGVPHPATKLQSNDILILLGKVADVDKFVESNQ
jgi:trk system potassium uptake protein TrkA